MIRYMGGGGGGGGKDQPVSEKINYHELSSARSTKMKRQIGFKSWKVAPSLNVKGNN